MKKFPELLSTDVEQISKDNMLAQVQKGDVILVKSDYKPEKYGNHFSLIVGGFIRKDRGLRPNLVTLPPTDVYNHLIAKYDPTDGAVILRLSSKKAQKVLDCYGLHLSEGDIIL